MKLELKTENEKFSKTFFSTFLIFFTIFFSIIIYDISLKLGNISRYYEINYLCRILIIDRSPNYFKRLAKLSNQGNKQKILDFCREISRK